MHRLTADSTIDADGVVHRDAASVRPWLEAVGAIAEAVNQAKPLNQVLDLIASMTVRQMGYDFCAVLMAAEDPPRLVIEGASGLSAEYIHRINDERPIHQLDQGAATEAPASRAFRERRPVVIPNIEAEPKFGPWAEFALEEGYRSMLCVPLIVSGAALGVLTCYASTERAFPPSERGLVETLAGEAAIAIEASGLRAREQATIADLARLNITLSTQRDQLERTEALHRELMGTALDDPGLPGTVEAVGRVIGQEVALYGPEVPTIPEATTLMDLDPGELLNADIVLDGTIVGHLVTATQVLAASDQSLARRALESGALVVALQLQRERTAEEVQFRLSRDLLGDLLSATESTDSWPIYQRASKLGHDLSKPHTVIVLRADSGSSDELHLDPGTVQRRLRNVVEASLQRYSPCPLLAPLQDNVVLLLQTPGSRENNDAEPLNPRRTAEHLLQRVRETLNPLTASIAIGSTCNQLNEYANAFKAATTALDMRRGRGTENVISLAEMGVFQFLLQVRHPEQLVRFSAELLEPLRKADRAALLPTLRAYLENSHSTAETAAALFVHVNTISYRMRKVEEILGLNLRDPGVLVNLKFALMIDDVLGS